MQITRVHTPLPLHPPPPPPPPGGPPRPGGPRLPPPPPLSLRGPAAAAAAEPGRAVQGQGWARLGCAEPGREATELRCCRPPPTLFGPGAMSGAGFVGSEVLGAAREGLRLGAAGPEAGNPGGGHTPAAEQ
ncbi:vasodilator-stimulated phosphoprotein-like [Petaurus breviceps papuanus]|uniref:vasodilator-stimulated phosphoprotein-like n=1 Tax=Petaurus breviceps papuanus TaxID=3040969 RepID=UPI0036DBB06E